MASGISNGLLYYIHISWVFQRIHHAQKQGFIAAALNQQCCCPCIQASAAVFSTSWLVCTPLSGILHQAAKLWVGVAGLNVARHVLELKI